MDERYFLKWSHWMISVSYRRHKWNFLATDTSAGGSTREFNSLAPAQLASATSKTAAKFLTLMIENPAAYLGKGIYPSGAKHGGSPYLVRIFYSSKVRTVRKPDKLPASEIEAICDKVIAEYSSTPESLLQAQVLCAWLRLGLINE